ncbi:GNAT family N-acetyltransferase [Leifsonia sp. 2TAF2]|uniref:GNAT family N-acetyltransferase n=1 Tax=Leifsonia sp. 2TAF2 TaxID=3233009 RepID=UPI003F985B58
MPPTFTIRRADFRSSALHDFVQSHLDDLEPTAPAESRHALGAESLQSPGVRLWVANDGPAIVGMAALAELGEPGHEELKSMRTDPARRGEGIAASLLAFVLDDARSRGIERVSLETGTMDFFAPARRLYARAGFTPCPPYGSYIEDPNSAFMTLLLSDAPR